MNQVLEAAACATFAKLWNLTKSLLQGSKSPGESGREMVDIKDMASAWYLAGAQEWRVVNIRLLQG